MSAINNQIYSSTNQPTSLCGFEGPEKLLEIWFTRPANWKTRDRLNTDNGSDSEDSEKVGLRSVDPSVWHEMLKIVQCQVLSTTHNEYCDAYLLSESSMFVYSNRLMLKTCGTTTLLHSVPRILEIAAKYCKLNQVDAIFYSRKAFLFPEKQEFPHGRWGDEVDYLDNIFTPTGFDTAGYVIGKVNGDHWCLYVATPLSLDSDGDTLEPETENVEDEDDDVTLEILMQDLNPEAMKAFWRTPDEQLQAKLPHNVNALKHQFKDNHRLYAETGLKHIYPDSVVDDYIFDPCGYSANGLAGPYYWTIHVTPESHCSYASFETTIPVKVFEHVAKDAHYDTFREVIQKVIDVFQPGKFSTTLFLRHTMKSHLQDIFLDKPIDGFRHRDRIHHSLGRWELVFSHFEKQAKPILTDR